MGYCFMSTQKIKSMGQLMAKYNHNYRQVEVDNADPNLANKNEELIKLPADENGRQLSYNDAWKNRVATLPHNIRSNAVLAIEVVTTFSRDDNIDLEQWKKENVNWLKKSFNVAGDGKDNVLSVIYHGDEAGNVHCHAMVVPVNPQGNLSASYFLDGSRKLSELQTSYSEDMKKFGLQRGLEGGHAKHRDIRKFYADLNNAKRIPMPEVDESANAFRDRMLENIEMLNLASMRDRDEKERAAQRKAAELRIKTEKECIKQREAMEKVCANLYDNTKRVVEKNLEQEFDKYAKTSKKVLELKKALSELEEQKNELENNIRRLDYKHSEEDMIEIKIKFYDEFQKKLNFIQETEPELAFQVEEILKEMENLYISNQQGKYIKDNVEL